MTKQLRERCIDCTNKFLKWELMELFKNRVEKQLGPDGYAEYLRYVKEPMCLLQVRDKLREDKYRTLDEYKRDMNLIWSNAILYNGEASYVGVLANCGRQKFDKKVAKLEMSPVESYIQKLAKVSKHLQNLSAAFEKEIDHMPSNYLYPEHK